MKKGALFFLCAFLLIWISSFVFFWKLNDWPTAGNIGDSFGAVGVLFSGVALVLAIYSASLQQQQNSQFQQDTQKSEQRMLDVLVQQSRAIALIEASLTQQVHAGRVAALTFMIDREEQRMESLREWGRNSHQNENYYSRGLETAQRRIQEYEDAVKKLGDFPQKGHA
jgi:hypothetical protein